MFRCLARCAKIDRIMGIRRSLTPFEVITDTRVDVECVDRI